MTPNQRFRIFARDGFACRYCGRKAPHVVLVVDHITPRASGGLDISSNLVTSCTDCNGGKSDLILREPPLVDPILGFSRAERVAVARARPPGREPRRTKRRCELCHRPTRSLSLAFTRADGRMIDGAAGLSYRAEARLVCIECANSRIAGPMYDIADQAEADRIVRFSTAEKRWVNGPLSCVESLEAAVRRLGFVPPDRRTWVS